MFVKEVETLLSEIYFYELEAREKIFNRLQLNFAIYASVVTILAYMIRKTDYGSNCVILTLFYVGIFAGSVLLSISIYYTIKSLTGFEYRLFPCSQEIIEYKAKLKKYEREIEEYNRENKISNQIKVDPNERTNEFVIKILAKCIDFNSKINEYRKQGIKKSLWYMIRATVPITFSALLFVVLDLDASSPRKNMLIEDKNIAVQLDKLISFIYTTLTHKQKEEEKPHMSNDSQNNQSNQSNKQTQTPPPPQPPQEPKWQISTEDFKAPMPDKVKLLNEHK